MYVEVTKISNTQCKSACSSNKTKNQQQSYFVYSSAFLSDTKTQIKKFRTCSIQRKIVYVYSVVGTNFGTNYIKIM